MGTMTGTSASSVLGMNASALPEFTGPMTAMTLSCSRKRVMLATAISGLTWSSRTVMSTLRPW